MDLSHDKTFNDKYEWYPTKIEDIDRFKNHILTRGNGIEDYDHPAF
jgi:hypothetical protein